MINDLFVLNPDVIPSLEQALLLAQEQLKLFASDTEFFAKMKMAFGENTDASELQDDWSTGDFSVFTNIEIRTSVDLNGAFGAFARATDTIYLSYEFVAANADNVGAITALLLEEAGHRVDAWLNTTDADGDEGEIFSALVRGKSLSEAEWQRVSGENDLGTIYLDGQRVQVEQMTGDMDHMDPVKAAEHQALLDLVPTDTATHIAFNSGDWFDSNTWADGIVPTEGAIVHIPENIHVTYEGYSETPLFAVRVDGHLTFTAGNGTDTKIVVDTLFTTSNSHFEIDADADTDGTVDIEIRPFNIEGYKAAGASGWNTAAIAHYSDGAVVTDTGAGTRDVAEYETVDDGSGILGRYGWDPQQLSLGVVTHGTVRVNGQQKLSKSTIAVTAMAGDTSIELDEVPTGWRVGDEIVITGTHYEGRIDVSATEGSQDEIRVITQIDGSIVTFDQALEFNHDTPRSDLKAYVANLTRNIEFHSATDLSIEGVLDANEVGGVASTLGHVMFMHNEDVQVRYASFDDLGRTNKNDALDDFERLFYDGLDAERATDRDGEWIKTPADRITNIRGRYAVHLHRAGAKATDTKALIEGSVVTGGPGWGFVSHDSRADFYDNVTYGVLGAGFISETGNETGTWSRNIAINTYGANFNSRVLDPGRNYRFTDNDTDLTMILEKRGAWKNHDLGHFGNGFWFQGKLIDAVDNVSVSSGLTGYFFQFRAPDQINVDPDVLVEPLQAHRPDGIHPFGPGLNVFTGNESIADTRGLDMIGLGSSRLSDERSVISDFTVWEVGNVGLQAQYYPGFTVKDSTFLASTSSDANPLDGILWRQVQLDTVLADLTLEGFEQQYDLRKKWSAGTFGIQGFQNPSLIIEEALANGEENPLPNGFAHVVLNPGFTAAEASQAQYLGETYDATYDQILTSDDLQLGRFNIEFDDESLKIDLDQKDIQYGTVDPTRPSLHQGHVLLLKGVKTDSIGTIPINYNNNILVWHEDGIQERLETFGYYHMPNGSLGVVLEELFSDRYTADKYVVRFLAELDPRWDLTGAIDLGNFDATSHPDVYVPQFLLGLPDAVADNISVDVDSSNNLINVLANDASFGEGLASISADSTSANGGIIAVADQSTADPTDDQIIYTPATAFNGIDTFSYTITDTSGNTDTAEVTVNVGEIDLLPEASPDALTVNANSTDNVVDVLENDSRFGDGLASLTADATSINGGTITVDDQGTTDLNDDLLLYTPATDFSGTDTFNYSITDTDGDISSAQVTITVNSAPAGDAVVRIDVGGNGFTDIYGNIWAADYGFQGGSTHYAVQEIANTDNDEIFYGKRYGESIAYDIALANGTYDVVLHMMEPNTNAAVGTRVIDVLAENELLLDNFDIFVALGVDAAPRTAVTATIQNVTVVDGILDLDFSQVANRPVNFAGIEIFLADGTPVNLQPNAIADTSTVNENSSSNLIEVLANDTSFGDGLASLTADVTSTNGGTITVDDQGTADPSDDRLLYTPATDFSGSDTFNYSITDTDGDISSAQVTVTVDPITPVDLLPNAVADILTVNTDSTDNVVDVLANDTSFGDGLASLTADAISINGATITIDDQGTVDSTDDVLLYTPATDFSGTDTFNYTITDIDGDTDTAEVSVTVNSVNTSTSEVTKVIASDGSADSWFGNSVFIDGNTAIVGASRDNAGSAYVYSQQADGSWLQTAKLNATDGQGGDQFGRNVAIDGNTAIIGSPRDNNGLNDSGSAYIFTLQADNSWVQTAMLTAADRDDNDEFGNSVSIDGDTALVGSFGDDDGGANSGSGYIFSRQEDGSWTQTAKLVASDASSGDLMGRRSISISGDTAVVGAYGNGTGSVYIFTRQGDGNWLETAKITPADGGNGDEFGRNVSVDGDTIVVGARHNDEAGEDSGATYIFNRQGDGSWTQTAKLTAADAAPGDRFGYSVFLKGNTLAIGAYNDDDNGTDSGSTYIFQRQADGSWTQVNKIIAPDGAETDWFGYSVSTDGNNLIVGAFRDDDNGNQSGSAYIYSLDSTNVGNLVPNAVADSISVEENSLNNTVDVIANDSSFGDGLVSLTANTNSINNGTVAVDDQGTTDPTDDLILYTPATDFEGIDHFSYIITDTDGDTDTAEVTVTVGTIDLVPNVVDDSITVNANSIDNVVNVLANDSSFGNGLASLTADNTSANGGSITMDDLGTTDPSDDVLLYTPATDFSGTDSFSYSIIDVDGDLVTGNVSVTVNPLPPEGDALIRIDVGGDGFTDIYGNLWSADYGFQGGSTHYAVQDIANTDNDEIFYAKRYGESISYDIPLANGTYDVVLHMMEPNRNATVGSRVFDVVAEGDLRLDNFDMYVALGADAAPRTAVTATITNVSVLDGQLDLDFTKEEGRPVNFAGMEVFLT